MALSITEQLQIMKGEVKPGEFSLYAFVNQIGMDAAIDFYQNAKTEATLEVIADATDKANAKSYKNKLFQIADKILKQDEATIKSLCRIIISIAGDSLDYANVQTAQPAGWEAFIKGANFTTAAEYLAGVRKEEKTAYNAA